MNNKYIKLLALCSLLSTNINFYAMVEGAQMAAMNVKTQNSGIVGSSASGSLIQGAQMAAMHGQAPTYSISGAVIPLLSTDSLTQVSFAIGSTGNPSATDISSVVLPKEYTTQIEQVVKGGFVVMLSAKVTRSIGLPGKYLQTIQATQLTQQGVVVKDLFVAGGQITVAPVESYFIFTISGKPGRLWGALTPNISNPNDVTVWTSPNFFIK